MKKMKSAENEKKEMKAIANIVKISENEIMAAYEKYG